MGLLPFRRFVSVRPLVDRRGTLLPTAAGVAVVGAEAAVRMHYLGGIPLAAGTTVGGTHSILPFPDVGVVAYYAAGEEGVDRHRGRWGGIPEEGGAAVGVLRPLRLQRGEVAEEEGVECREPHHQHHPQGAIPLEAMKKTARPPAAPPVRAEEVRAGEGGDLEESVVHA